MLRSDLRNLGWQDVDDSLFCAGYAPAYAEVKHHVVCYSNADGGWFDTSKAVPPAVAENILKELS